MTVRRTRRLLTRRRGFTLIELLTVVMIIGILAALILPRFIGRTGEAKQAVARQKIAVLEAKVLEFNTDCGRFPSSQEGLAALTRRPADVGEKWHGPYVKDKDILDPWDQEFVFRCPGRQNADFDILTLGKDGQEGGEGEDADLGNW